jgi:hypothetical protein
MTTRPKLTTLLACEVAGINRDRFNEHVAAGYFPCAPQTVPGRARTFDPDDMLGLRLFADLIKDGFEPRAAGPIACEVAQVARHNPDAPVICYVQTFFSGGTACLPSEVPAPEKWDSEGFGTGRVRPDIRKVTTFRVGKLRELNAHYTAEENSIIGPRDE